MTTSYIISQILALLSFLLSLLAYYRKNKEKIMGTMVVSNVLNLIHYFILWATSWGITKILAILRDSIIIYKEKKHFNLDIVLIFFVIAYIVVAIFTYKWIYSLLPLLAAIIYIISIWNWNEWIIKKSAFFCYFLRLIYNICVWSIVAIIANIISIISTFFAVIIHKKWTKKK